MSSQSSEDSKGDIVLSLPTGLPWTFERVGNDALSAIETLLFGVERAGLDLEAWKRQSFKFSNKTGVSFGLEQKKGGPCGVLASVQAEIIKYLVYIKPELNGLSELFDYSSEKYTAALAGASENLNWLPEWCNPSDCVEAIRLLKNPIEERFEALVVSFVSIIARAVQAQCEDRVDEQTRQTMLQGFHESITAHSQAVVDRPGINLPFDPLVPITLILPVERITDLQQGSKPAQASIDDGVNEGRTEEKENVVYSITLPAKCAVELLFANPELLTDGCGVLAFVYSLIASRSVPIVQSDMDDPSECLVVRFGHTSQELVNLMLTGVACSNVFDDNRSMTLSEAETAGAGSMKGVRSAPDVGYLCVHEVLRYLEVGDKLKNPKYPLWIVGSESHYTVLFALDSRVGKRSEHESREAELRAIFQQLDPQSSGFLSYESAAVLTAALGKNFERLQSSLDPNGNGVILWSDVKTVFCPVITKDSEHSAKKGADNSAGNDDHEPNAGVDQTTEVDLSPWTCNVCTVQNDTGALTRCTVCDTPKPKRKPNPKPSTQPVGDSRSDFPKSSETGVLRLKRVAGSDHPQHFSLYHVNGLGGAGAGAGSKTSSKTNDIYVLERKATEARSMYETALSAAQSQAMQLEMTIEECIAAEIVHNPAPLLEQAEKAESLVLAAKQVEAQNESTQSEPKTTPNTDDSENKSNLAIPILGDATESVLTPDARTSVTVRECVISLQDSLDASIQGTSAALTLREIIGTRWKSAEVEFVTGDPSLN